MCDESSLNVFKCQYSEKSIQNLNGQVWSHTRVKVWLVEAGGTDVNVPSLRGFSGYLLPLCEYREEVNGLWTEGG